MRNQSFELYSGATIADLYVSAFKAFPDKTALVDAKQSLTYRELEARCFQVARCLLDEGLANQDTVALLVGNSVDAVVAIIATQLLGLRYIALHPMAAEDDHSFVLEDASVKVLIADEGKFLDRALALRQQNTNIKLVTLGASIEYAGLINNAFDKDSTPFPITVSPHSYTKISYSGGTTGRSKGILHTHRTTVTMVNYQLATYEWPEDIRFLAATPISHAAGSLILPTFIRGGATYLLDKYDPESFLRMVQAYRINTSFLVPTQIYGLIDLPNLETFDYSSLHLVLYGASPIAPVRLLQAMEKFGIIFGQLYGQAEAPMVISYLRKQEHNPLQPHMLSSCGRVVAGNYVKLLDNNLQEVKQGEIGELCVRGPLLMEGYLNRPEENEKVFRGDWLHTGDMAKMDEHGFLYIVDRAKDMIITGGFNVYPTEVENCLAQHPAISAVAVIGVPHEKWGEEVTACVVKREGMNPSKEDLIDFALRHKGKVNAPKAIHFLSELPLTSLGKIDKKALRASFWKDKDRQVS